MNDLAAASLWHDRANWSRGNRAVGGRLYLTSTNLIFVPNVIEQELGERIVGWYREIFVGVELAPISWRDALRQPYSGAVRRRLRFLTTEGELLFVVPKPSKTVDAVAAALCTAAGAR